MITLSDQACCKICHTAASFPEAAGHIAVVFNVQKKYPDGRGDDKKYIGIRIKDHKKRQVNNV